MTELMLKLQNKHNCYVSRYVYKYAAIRVLSHITISHVLLTVMVILSYSHSISKPLSTQRPRVVSTDTYWSVKDDAIPKTLCEEFDVIFELLVTDSMHN